MRTHWITAILASVLVLALASCSSGDQANQASQTQASQTTATTESPDAAAGTATTAQTASATIEGTLGCGHCTHHIGTSCSAAVQTADGTVYILEDMKAGSQPFDKRFDAGQIKVVGTVAERDGVHYVKVSSFEML